MVRPARPTTDQNASHQVRRGSLSVARVSPSQQYTPLRVQTILYSTLLPFPMLQLPMGRLRAPSRRLRDRTRPKRALDRATTALRSLLAALMEPMPVLRPSPALTLARVVCARARRHAGDLGRARSGDGVCSPCACVNGTFFLFLFFPFPRTEHRGGGWVTVVDSFIKL